MRQLYTEDLTTDGNDSHSQRSGYFWLHRGDLERIRLACGRQGGRGRRGDGGAVAEDLFARLAKNARATAGTATYEGIELVIPAGATLFARRSYADLMGRSPSAVYRALRKLVKMGEVEIVPANFILNSISKVDRRRLPTVVKLCHIERYTSQVERARRHFQNYFGPLEQESISIEALEHGSMSAKEESDFLIEKVPINSKTQWEEEETEVPAAHAAPEPPADFFAFAARADRDPARAVLGSYIVRGGKVRSAENACREIRARLAEGWSPDGLLAAVETHNDRCRAEGATGRLFAEHLFLATTLTRYLPLPPAGHRHRASDGDSLHEVRI